MMWFRSTDSEKTLKNTLSSGLSDYEITMDKGIITEMIGYRRKTWVYIYIRIGHMPESTALHLNFNIKSFGHPKELFIMFEVLFWRVPKTDFSHRGDPYVKKSRYVKSVDMVKMLSKNRIRIIENSRNFRKRHNFSCFFEWAIIW